MLKGSQGVKHGSTDLLQLHGNAAGHAAEGLLWVGFSIICGVRLLSKYILEHTLHVDLDAAQIYKL